MPGPKFVKVAVLGQQVQEFALEDGQTARQLLDQQGIAYGGMTIQVNGRTGAENTALQDGDRIVLVPSIKGGAAV